MFSPRAGSFPPDTEPANDMPTNRSMREPRQAVADQTLGREFSAEFVVNVNADDVVERLFGRREAEL